MAIQLEAHPHLDDELFRTYVLHAEQQGLTPWVKDFVREHHGSCFDLMRVLTRLVVHAGVSPLEVASALRAVRIHPASWLLAVAPELRGEYAEAMDLRMPDLWRRILGLPEGPDGPPPEHLRVPGSLSIENAPISALPRDLAVEENLVMEDLPLLRHLPSDLWHGNRIEVFRCKAFQGWPASDLAKVKHREARRQALGVPESSGLFWVVEDCPGFETLPPRLESDISLSIHRCPSFRRLPRLSPQRGRACISLSETLPGVRRLSNLTALKLDLAELIDLEEIDGLGPVEGATAVVASLRGLAKLRSLKGFKSQVQLDVQACPRLKQIRLSAAIVGLRLADLSGLERISGTFAGQMLSVERCDSLVHWPCLGSATEMVKSVDCLNLRRPALPDSARFVWRRFESITVEESGRLPQGAEYGLGRQADLVARLDVGRIEVHELREGVERAQTVFQKVRLLARSLYAGLPAAEVRQLLEAHGIHPVSLLLDLPYGARIQRLAQRLDLPVEFRTMSPMGTYAGEAGVGDEIGLTPRFLELSNLKIPGHARLWFQPLAEGLPEGLEVEGNLWISHVKDLRSLPRHLRVGGDLFLHELPDLEALPEDLVLGGELRIAGLPKLKVWPKMARIRGGIRLDSNG